MEHAEDRTGRELGACLTEGRRGDCVRERDATHPRVVPERAEDVVVAMHGRIGSLEDEQADEQLRREPPAA